LLKATTLELLCKVKPESTRRLPETIQISLQLENLGSSMLVILLETMGHLDINTFSVR
jgi:hypothetical protein